MVDCFFVERALKFDPIHAEQTRKKYLCNSLHSNKKINLYNCSIKGDVDGLKNLIEKEKYSLLEECSTAGYYWTALHYAAHYGFTNIVEFFLEKYNNHPDKLDIANLQSNLGLSPLFLALNNSLDLKIKKQMLEIYVKYNAIDFKICNTENLDIFDLCKKNELLEYFLSILRED